MSLDKRYDFKKVEENKYDFWKENGFFKAGDKTKVKFSIVIPPPNVTGKLHIGHGIDNTIQDITVRYKKAKGYDCLYLPGCDHAGIATQAKVDARLKEEGISRYDIGREAYLKKAYEWKDEYSSIIHDQWKKMGLMLDYSRERFTLDDGFKDAVYEVFKKLYDDGLIYRGEKIVNYDPVLKTALSNIEINYQEDDGEFYYFKYPFKDDNNKFLIIATTRPETMFGDVCVVVNPNDKRYKDLVGKCVINPANNDVLPIIGDEYVDIDFGTGAMKCTPAHDPNDFIIGQKYNLAHPVIMNTDGTMNELCGQYSGLDRYECRNKLVENIKNDGNLIKIEKTKHQVGHSERSGAVVEPILSKQWFIKMKPLAKSVLENQKTKDKVKFYPSRFEKVLIQWMNNCEDWCISRQLWWGHRIPAYYNLKTKEVVISRFIPENNGEWVQDEDVLDTWFSSALWPFATLGWPKDTDDLKRYFPTDLMITGYDIIFFWVARMYFQSLYFTKQIPFKAVLIHGIVRDSKGRKMSKSLGNGVDPIDIINRYGVDSLRYYLATTASPGLDMRFEEEKVNSASNYLNKIWNSARYILLNLPNNYVFPNSFNKNELNLIDKWILTKFNITVKNVTKYMDKYEYGIASSYLFNFVYDDFCSKYIEYSKISLQNDNFNKESTYFTLIKVLKGVIMMIYPFSPFITEEIYQSLPNHMKSIMLESYPIYEKAYVFPHSIDDVNKLIISIEKIRSYKVENDLAPNSEITLKIKGEGFNTDLLPYLKRFAFANNVELITKEEKLTCFVFEDFTLYVAGNINNEELLDKLNSELEKLKFEIDRGEKLLANNGFIAKAPKEKVEAEKNKLKTNKAKYQETILKINNLNR